jgi:hypothetical protein
MLIGTEVRLHNGKKYQDKYVYIMTSYVLYSTRRVQERGYGADKEVTGNQESSCLRFSVSEHKNLSEHTELKKVFINKHSQTLVAFLINLYVDRTMKDAVIYVSLPPLHWSFNNRCSA